MGLKNWGVRKVSAHPNYEFCVAWKFSKQKCWLVGWHIKHLLFSIKHLQNNMKKHTVRKSYTAFSSRINYLDEKWLLNATIVSGDTRKLHGVSCGVIRRTVCYGIRQICCQGGKKRQLLENKLLVHDILIILMKVGRRHSFCPCERVSLTFSLINLILLKSCSLHLWTIHFHPLRWKNAELFHSKNCFNNVVCFPFCIIKYLRSDGLR